METHAQHQLLEKALGFLKNGGTHMVDDISTIPLSVYTDEGQYQKEEQKLFKSIPITVGHEDMVKNPGDYFTRDICGVPFVLLRDSNGALKCFINVCKHRGGRLATEESGSGLKALVCSYHAWTYKTDGELRGIPHKEGFEGLPDNCRRLSELPLAVWNGFLVIRLTPLGDGETQEQFQQQVISHMGENLAQDFASFATSSHIVFDEKKFHRPINWKLSIDTFLENYHVRKTHSDTIDYMFLDNVGCYEKFDHQQRNLYLKKSVASLVDAPRSDWNLREHGNLLYLLFPNALILIEPDHINVSLIFPDGIGNSFLYNFTLLPEPPSEKGVAYFRKNNTLLYDALEEDFTMAGDVQKGLLSGANTELVHGRYEQGLRYFHESVDKFCNA
jgi:phenylpropionate dioxygenase-like ring-hydroxylating dioxygenase large terminal subunit